MNTKSICSLHNLFQYTNKHPILSSSVVYNDNLLEMSHRDPDLGFWSFGLIGLWVQEAMLGADLVYVAAPLVLCRLSNRKSCPDGLRGTLGVKSNYDKRSGGSKSKHITTTCRYTTKRVRKRKGGQKKLTKLGLTLFLKNCPKRVSGLNQVLRRRIRSVIVCPSQYTKKHPNGEPV